MNNPAEKHNFDQDAGEACRAAGITHPEALKRMIDKLNSLRVMFPNDTLTSEINELFDACGIENKEG